VYDDARNEPAAYLEARADDYVAAASMAELAARIRAGLRRLGWQRTAG
jgi:DNA-binding response OmpR family regulator